MLLPDVNILVNAHRKDAVDHGRYRDWLAGLIAGDEAYGMSDLVLSAFLRIVTHPRIYPDPTPLEEALAFVDDVRTPFHRVTVAPGVRHWDIFVGLCQSVGARGGLVPDAYLAALAIESGSEWITNDGDFARFPGLRWRRPFIS
jgi:hypothetical protein